MHPVWVVIVYGFAVTLALLLLHFFHMRAWYWHALSIAAAAGIGTVQVPDRWIGPAFDLAIGFVFALLAVWGLAAPFFRHPHHDHHLHKHA